MFNNTENYLIHGSIFTMITLLFLTLKMLLSLIGIHDLIMHKSIYHYY